MQHWLVRVWDGNSTHTYSRYGTYDQVYNSLSGLPPAYIWSIQ